MHLGERNSLMGNSQENGGKDPYESPYNPLNLHFKFSIEHTHPFYPFKSPKTELKDPKSQPLPTLRLSSSRWI